MGKLKFARENVKENKTLDTWKVLIVDDEPEIHSMTKTVLSDFIIDERKLEFLSAYSGSEAIEILKNNEDIVVILLDVVMETNDAGLIVTQKIREELNNSLVRIILRTGQPGSAPEEEVIVKYRINDYKEKTELTAKKLFSSMVTAIRSYQDLLTIRKSKDGLEKIIDATKSISQERSLEIFAEGVLIQLISILNLHNNSLIINSNSALSIEKNENNYKILASTGEYKDEKDFNLIDNNIKDLIFHAIKKEKTQFFEENYIGYFSFSNNVSYIVYISGCANIDSLDKRLTEIFSNNIAVAFNNLALNQEILDTQKEIIERLGEVVEKRSKEASKHVFRVAECSYLLAKDYGIEESQCQLLRMASPMHDVGKIGIPDNILLKPGKLTVDEFKIMQTHSDIGYEILKASNRIMLQSAAIIAHEHHEKFDGSGYPLKKRGEEIHIFARITAVVDVLDALYHKRCYKDPWPLEDILSLLEEQKNKHFDARLVDLILKDVDRYINIIKLV